MYVKLPSGQNINPQTFAGITFQCYKKYYISSLFLTVDTVVN